MALATLGRSTAFFAFTCRTTLTAPDSSPFFHVDRIDDQVQQPPSTSPDPAARRIIEVPLSPSINWTRSPSAARKIVGTSESLAPGASPPRLTGFFGASHWS